jgi:hypothetical protein
MDPFGGINKILYNCVQNSGTKADQSKHKLSQEGDTSWNIATYYKSLV